MDNPLRSEIIGHIEASGELACWIVPYLYHAAYQTVKEMEREGAIVIEVGKRGEPVYVFAANKPLTLAEIYMLNMISRMEANNQPLRSAELGMNDAQLIQSLLVLRYIRAEMEDGFTTYFMTDAGREKWSALRTPAAAPDSAAVPSEKTATSPNIPVARRTYPTLQEAIEASRKADIEMYAEQTAVVESEMMLNAPPPQADPGDAAAKLTKAQREALSVLGKVEKAYIGNKSYLYKDVIGGQLGCVNSSAVKALVSRGLAQRKGVMYAVITDDGRAALKASER
jgi:hypothetical protein